MASTSICEAVTSSYLTAASDSRKISNPRFEMVFMYIRVFPSDFAQLLPAAQLCPVIYCPLDLLKVEHPVEPLYGVYTFTSGKEQNPNFALPPMTYILPSTTSTDIEHLPTGISSSFDHVSVEGSYASTTEVITLPSTMPPMA